jgi:hypothetical protein
MRPGSTYERSRDNNWRSEDRVASQIRSVIWMWPSLAGVVQALFLWVFLAGIIIGPQFLRTRDRNELYETLRIANEKGQPTPAQLIDPLINDARYTQPFLPTPGREFHRGLVLVLNGLGFAAAAYDLYVGVSLHSDTGAWITGECVAAVGAVAGFIRLAYLVL